MSLNLPSRTRVHTRGAPAAAGAGMLEAHARGEVDAVNARAGADLVRRCPTPITPSSSSWTTKRRFARSSGDPREGRLPCHRSRRRRRGADPARGYTGLDLLTADLEMPELAGEEVVRRIRVARPDSEECSTSPATSIACSTPARRSGRARRFSTSHLRHAACSRRCRCSSMEGCPRPSSTLNASCLRVLSTSRSRAASGVLLALSFPKFGHPALGWIALAPLLVALSCAHDRCGAPSRSGWSTGIVYFTGTLYWITLRDGDLRRTWRRGSRC